MNKNSIGILTFVVAVDPESRCEVPIEYYHHGFPSVVELSLVCLVGTY